MGSQLLNVSEIVYNFIDTYQRLFNLDDITEDHSLDLNCLEKYIDYQKTEKTKRFWDFYKYMYENIVYISNKEINCQYSRNAVELYNFHKNNNCDIVVILTESRKKSNFYFTLYFLYIYRNMYQNDYKHIKVINETDLELNDNYSISNCVTIDYTRHTIYVVSDDFCYSGLQLNILLRKYYRERMFPHLQNDSSNFSVYVNVVGMTKDALKQFEKEVDKLKLLGIDNVINRIPSKCLIIENKSYNDIFAKYCEKEINGEKRPNIDLFYYHYGDLRLQSLLHTIVPRKDKPLIYLSFKYPDHVSTIQYMCYFKQLNNTYFVSEVDYSNLYINDKIVHDNKIHHYVLVEDTLTLPNITKEEFKHNCSLLEWVIELKDISSFQELYPHCVYSHDDETKILKLIKNCNYEYGGNYSNNLYPECGNFCYKPFYKKSEYKQILDTMIFEESNLNDILTKIDLFKSKRTSVGKKVKKSKRKSMKKLSHRKSVKMISSIERKQNYHYLL